MDRNEIKKIVESANNPEIVYELVKNRISRKYKNKLYQYCSFSDNHDPYNTSQFKAGKNRYFQNVLNRIVFASKPSGFNDPFDSTIGMSDRSILSDFLRTYLNANYIEMDISKGRIKEMFEDSSLRAYHINNLKTGKRYLLGDILLEILEDDELYYTFHKSNEHEIFKSKKMTIIEEKKLLISIFRRKSFQDSFINNFIDAKNYNEEAALNLKSLFDNERFLIEALLVKPVTAEIDLHNKSLEFEVSLDKVDFMRENHVSNVSENDIENMKVAVKNATDIAFKGLNEFYAKVNEQFGITCFSKKKDIPLMWSHYAYKHTGFVIEYDFSSLTIEYSQKLAFLLPVRYEKTRKRLNADLVKEYMENEKYLPDEKLISMFIDVIYVKAREWRYEHEVRNIVKVKDENGRKIPFKYIKSIILGAKSSEKTKNIIKEMCLVEKIDLYEYSIHEDKYSLVLAKVNLMDQMVKVEDYAKKHKITDIALIKKMIDDGLIVDTKVVDNQYYVSKKMWKIDPSNLTIGDREKDYNELICSSIIDKLHVNHKMLGIKEAHFKKLLMLLVRKKIIIRKIGMHPSKIESYRIDVKEK